ncbi:hypothetical protein MAR_013986, partial [Mya arenaria]
MTVVGSWIHYVCMPFEFCDMIMHCEISSDCCFNVSKHSIMLYEHKRSTYSTGLNWKTVNDANTKLDQTMPLNDDEFTN